MHQLDVAIDSSITHYVTPFAALMNAASETAAMATLQDAVRELGFDHTMYAVIPQPKVNFDEVYLRSNYAEAWREHYDSNNLRNSDPTVEHCFKATSPFVWMPQSFTTEAQQELYEEAAAFGLRVGVTLPIHGPAGEVGMLTCVRDQAPGAGFVNDLQHILGRLSLLRDVAFDSMRKYMLPDETADAPPVLTARELHCLQWVAAGKTSWEIGRILRISEAGVNFHISNLRSKFGVNKRNDVVLKAIRQGLINLPG